MCRITTLTYRAEDRLDEKRKTTEFASHTSYICDIERNSCEMWCEMEKMTNYQVIDCQVTISSRDSRSGI